MFEEVAEVLASQLGISKAKITPDSEIIKDLGADSIDVAEMIMTLEEKSGKIIPAELVAKIKTVGDVVSTLQSL